MLTFTAACLFVSFVCVRCLSADAFPEAKKYGSSLRTRRMHIGRKQKPTRLFIGMCLCKRSCAYAYLLANVFVCVDASCLRPHQRACILQTRARIRAIEDLNSYVEPSHILFCTLQVPELTRKLEKIHGAGIPAAKGSQGRKHLTTLDIVSFVQADTCHSCAM